MKLVHFSRSDSDDICIGVEHPAGIVDISEASRRGLLELEPNLTIPDLFANPDRTAALESFIGRLSDADFQAPSVAIDDVRRRAPVTRTQKIFGIGLNYHDHAEELGMEKPREPLLFAMFANTIIGPGDPIRIPRVSDKIDYEAELGVVIGRPGRHIPPEQATAHIAGYTIVNDVSARDLQMNDSQWLRGKSFDTALPMGPVLVPTSVLNDGDGLSIRLRLNGRTMQESNTRHMIFKVPALIAYISEAFTLEPGDVIATGTPGGVGFKRRPPVYLQPGDTVEIEIEGIGTLRNPVTVE